MIKNKYNIKIIDGIDVDIDKIIEEYNPEEEENINWGVTLQDRETEHIILNV